ncbi:MAG: ribonuclease P protein component [Candidatus Aminicenantales bacterium]
MDEGFRPRERIKQKKDFNRLYKKGKRFRGRYFILVYQPNASGHSRIAVVASRKLGNAVERNRIKRWFRDLYRRNKDLLSTSLDLVIIPQRDIHSVSWDTLRQEFRKALSSIAAQNQPG